jgi:hypothetical protein
MNWIQWKRNKRTWRPVQIRCIAADGGDDPNNLFVSSAMSVTFLCLATFLGEVLHYIPAQTRTLLATTAHAPRTTLL